ncbi:hypothetical protein HQ35_04425 [Porphyromonas cangingivalis]|uniref:Uncharacterized protein n=2 Tax=Porphyromonas cangingivalis TaxID=36874 RepID=A0A0A2ER35_PORCN|nr:hypothetical protein HQ35_04425 [Porphyromonas cangingivalis]
MAQTTMPDTIYIKCNLLQKFPEGQWQKVSDTEILYLQDVGATSYLSVRSHKYLTYEEYNALEFTFMEKLAKALNISQKGEYSNLHKKMPKLFLVMDPDSVIDGIEVLEVVDWSIIRHQTRHPAMFFYCDELEKQKLIDGVVHFWQVRYFEMSDDECDFRAEWHINSIKSPNITDPNPEKMFVFSGDIPYKVVDEEWVKSVKKTNIFDIHCRHAYPGKLYKPSYFYPEVYIIYKYDDKYYLFDVVLWYQIWLIFMSPEPFTID